MLYLILLILYLLSMASKWPELRIVFSNKMV